MPSARDIPSLRTARLLLRPWRDEDLDAWADLNADPRVMEQMGGPREPAQSAAAVQRIRAHFDRHGFGVWAVELPGAVRFIGFIGLAVPEFQAHFTPCVEVGWRLAYDHWGKGYATEGARAALDHGFERLGLSQIVSFTAATNARSRRVMERIGMRRDPAEDFDHPGLPAGDPLRRHVLYRIAASEARMPTGQG